MSVDEIKLRATQLVDAYSEDLETTLIEECVHFKTFVPAASILKGRNVKPSALSIYFICYFQKILIAFSPTLILPFECFSQLHVQTVLLNDHSRH